MTQFISLKEIRRVHVGRSLTSGIIKVFYKDGECFEYSFDTINKANITYVKSRTHLLTNKISWRWSYDPHH